MTDSISDDQRRAGLVIDLDRLEEQAETLFLHRFVEKVRAARNEHGRYLTLRPGDELAIHAADDGSADSLDRVSVEIDLE